MNNTFIEFILFLAVLLGGFYAGTGFFVAMGGNPAIKKMSDRVFAEYWQHTDHFMAARMKVFGPLLLLCILSAVLVLLITSDMISFACMLAAFCLLLTDIIFTLSTNHPLNRLIQSWNLNKLPSDTHQVKARVVKAFNTRIIFMIGAFIMVLLALWFHTTKNIL